jgi:hypothetical protein
MGQYINHHVVMTGDVETIKAIVDKHLTPVPEAYEPGSDLPWIDFNTIGVHGFCLHPEWLSGPEIRSPFKVGLEQKYHSQMGDMKEFIDALRARYPTVQIDAAKVCDCMYREECVCGRWTRAPGRWEHLYGYEGECEYAAHEHHTPHGLEIDFDDVVLIESDDWIKDETKHGGRAF